MKRVWLTSGSSNWIIEIYDIISDAGCPYISGALKRAMTPYRPKTMSSYRRQFHTFLCFSIKNKAPTVLSVHNLIAFLEFLVACNLSPRAIANYVSAIKSYASLYQLPVCWMSNQLIANYIRALHIQVVHVKKEKLTLSLKDLLHVSQQLEQFDNPLVYRSAFLLSYYGFLRISNLVAATTTGFDVQRQLCRKDITFSSTHVRVMLRWAKNLQKAEQSHVVFLPKMSNVYLCPYVTLAKLFAAQDYRGNDPVIKIGKTHVIEAQLRKRLTLILKLLNMRSECLTYHALRRSGASLAFNNNVNFESIRAQGAWQSDAIWQYLFVNSQKAQEVADMFKQVEKGW